MARERLNPKNEIPVVSIASVKLAEATYRCGFEGDFLESMSHLNSFRVAPRLTDSRAE